MENWAGRIPSPGTFSEELAKVNLVMIAVWFREEDALAISVRSSPR